jgi:hypothetical protein
MSTWDASCRVTPSDPSEREQQFEHLKDLWFTWACATEALLLAGASLDDMFESAKAHVGDRRRYGAQARQDAVDSADTGELAGWIFNPAFLEHHRSHRIRNQMDGLMGSGD